MAKPTGIATLAALLLLLAVWQTVTDLHLLLLSALVLATLLEPIPATVVGSICGMMTDMLTPEHSGYFAATATVVCFFISKLFEMRWRRYWLSAAVISSIAVLIIVCGYFCLFRLAADPDRNMLFIRHYLPRIGLTAAGSVPLYGLFHRIIR